jgi:hypothetical protein
LFTIMKHGNTAVNKKSVFCVFSGSFYTTRVRREPGAPPAGDRDILFDMTRDPSDTIPETVPPHEDTKEAVNGEQPPHHPASGAPDVFDR